MISTNVCASTRFLVSTVAFALLLSVGGLTAPAQAQDEDPTVGVIYWKCDYADVEKIEQVADSVGAPIYQELVNEGEIMNWKMMTHQWGDSWNVIFQITAEDTPAFLDAFEKARQRIQERHPDLTSITEYCTEHKDNIYTLSTSTSPRGEDSQ